MSQRTRLFCSKRWNDIPFAHRQVLHEGHCSLIHGHNWDIEVRFSARRTDKNGFVVDFGKLKGMKNYLEKFDHALVLRDDDPLACKLDDSICNLITLPDASSEGLAVHLFGEFNLILESDDELADARSRGVKIVEIVVHEDRKNSARFTI